MSGIVLTWQPSWVVSPPHADTCSPQHRRRSASVFELQHNTGAQERNMSRDEPLSWDTYPEEVLSSSKGTSGFASSKKQASAKWSLNLRSYKHVSFTQTSESHFRSVYLLKQILLEVRSDKNCGRKRLTPKRGSMFWSVFFKVIFIRQTATDMWPNLKEILRKMRVHITFCSQESSLCGLF